MGNDYVLRNIEYTDVCYFMNAVSRLGRQHVHQRYRLFAIDHTNQILVMEYQWLIFSIDFNLHSVKFGMFS